MLTVSSSLKIGITALGTQQMLLNHKYYILEPKETNHCFNILQENHRGHVWPKMLSILWLTAFSSVLLVISIITIHNHYIHRSHTNETYT